MTDPSNDTTEPDDERVESRADLLPEEEAAGSDDPTAQAREILSESDERVVSREDVVTDHIEERTSDEVTDDV
jgi:hypothetical protein